MATLNHDSEEFLRMKEMEADSLGRACQRCQSGKMNGIIPDFSACGLALA